MKVNPDDGLSHSNVKAIVRDNMGFVWIGTKNGLDRFDGSSVRNYICIDSVTGHVDNTVNALYDTPDYLWVGVDTGVFRYDKKTERFHFLNQKTSDGQRIGNWIGQIVEDRSKTIWIIVPGHGVFSFKNEKLEKANAAPGVKINSNPSCAVIGSDGRLWIGSWNKGLFYKNDGERNFKILKTDRSGLDLTSLEITSLSFIDNDLYIATQGGRLFRLDTITLTSCPVEFGNPKGNIIRALSNDGKNLFIGTYDGLYVIDSANRVTHLRHNPLDPTSICDDIIFSLYNDKNGDLWIGTLFGGASYYARNAIDFRKNISPGGHPFTLSSDRIRGLEFDSSGNLWVGTEGAGIQRVSPSGNVTRFGNPNSTIFSIRNIGNNIYWGTYSDGMYAVSKDGNMRHYSPEELNIEDANVFAIFRDSKDNFWVGNGRGAWKTAPGAMRFQKIKELTEVWIHDIEEDRSGNIWFASNGKGIWRMDRGGKLKNYSAKNSATGLRSDNVTAVFVDSKNRQWFSTDHGGLALYNEKGDNFTTFSTEQGLPDDVTYDILEDRHGNIWFGTNSGIVCFDPEKKTVTTFDKSHGLRGNLFNYSSAAKDSDGTLYFGGQEGIVSFLPGNAKDTEVSKLYFSKLVVNGREMLPEDKDSPLTKSILFTDEIKLPSRDSNISLQLSMPVCWGGKSTKYYYRLDPLDSDWRQVNGNTLNFAGLAPGRYTLQVKGQTSDGEEAYGEMKLRISPPWYASIWAWILYVILFVSSAGVAIWLYRRKKEKQFRNLQRMIDMENEKEIYESKLGFFTEVAHEIRTPVTLISAPLESIKEMGISNPDLNYNIDIIEANTSRLLALISQILDLEKVGKEKYVLNCKCRNVSDIVYDTVRRFESAFAHAGQKFTASIPDDALWANVDQDAMIKILSNLLNNALKYGEHDTSVTLSSEGTALSLRVSNDGNLIPPEMREKIFRPFVRGDATRYLKPGSGIGLGLAKALATLQGGKLYIDDAVRERNSFVLEIPMCEPSEEMVREAKPKVAERNDVTLPDPREEKSSARLLIVEDNEEIREFLAKRLNTYFRTVSASNGAEALEKLKKGTIDLVITDLMMPKMSGIELCERIKGDETLSHIPVIILTAKNDMNSRLTGFRCGAEAFVEKPFNFSILKEQISTLVRNRLNEREAFSRSPYLSITPSKDGSEADKEFNNRFMKIVEENLSDENFNVERMADELCLSRSALFRKLKQQYDMAPVVLLRTIRLKKGAQLIATGKYRIAEIGPMVGISSPSYFNSQFQKQFGMTPKEYEHQCHMRHETLEGK